MLKFVIDAMTSANLIIYATQPDDHIAIGTEEKDNFQSVRLAGYEKSQSACVIN